MSWRTESWRGDRLRMDETYRVRAPIRYGRLPENRGKTCTMVFSQGSEAGEAIAVRCRNDVASAADLIAERRLPWLMHAPVAPMNPWASRVRDRNRKAETLRGRSGEGAR